MLENEDDFCHCGNLTQYAEGMEQGFQNYGLWYGYCADCALVRCDAYPGACK
jgi:hypothetical protein